MCAIHPASGFDLAGSRRSGPAAGGDRTPSAEPTTILCATDFSPASSAAWTFARRLAREVGARLLLLHVLPTPSGDRAGETHATLERLIEFAGDDGLSVGVRVEPGPAADGILRAVEQDAVDLLVVGTHGRTGLDRLLLGSVAEEVVRQAPCPVITVPPRPARPEAGRRPLRRLLCAAEHPSVATQARRWAMALAQATGAALDVLDHPAWGGDAIVARAVAQRADLLVMGVIAGPGVAGEVLDGVTRRLLYAAPCPVLTVGPRTRAPEAPRAN